MKNPWFAKVKTVFSGKRADIAILFFLLLLSGFAYHRWLFSLEPLTSGDWPFFWRESLIAQRLHSFSLWSFQGLGRLVPEIGQAPTYIWYGILARYFHLDYNLAERIIHVWPIIFFTPLFAYLWLRQHFSLKTAAVVGTLIYTFNTYFLLIQTGQLTIMAAYAFVPLVVLFCEKTLQQQKIMHAVFTTLVLFVISAYEPRIFYIVCWIMLLYSVYFFFFLSTKKNLKLVLLALAPFVGTFLLNFYWIFALSQVTDVAQNELLQRGLFGGNFISILHALTLQHPFWTGGKPLIFEVQSVPWPLIVIPLAAFAGLFLNRKNKEVIFYVLLALLGIFLTKQNNAPFGDVYTWLYETVPGFQLFRESSKFYILIVLGYTLLIGSLINTLWQKKQSSRSLKILITVAIAGMFLVNTVPLISGSIGGLFASRGTPPESYRTMKDLLRQDKTFSRTLWIPQASRWTFDSLDHPAVDIKTLLDDYQKFSLNNNTVSVTDYLMTEQFRDKLINVSVGYVVLPAKGDQEHSDFYFPYEGEQEEYGKILAALPFLKRIDLTDSDMIVYHHQSAKAHAYTNGGNDLQLTVKRPTLYALTVQNDVPVEMIHFSEAYHPDWVLTIRDTAGGSTYDVSATPSEWFTNTFVIPDAVAGDLAGKTITISFRPQKFIWLGGIVSAITLVILVGYIPVYFSKKYVQNKIPGQ